MKHFVVDYKLPKPNTSLALLQYRQNQTYVAPYLSHLQIRGSKSQTSMLKVIFDTYQCIMYEQSILLEIFSKFYSLFFTAVEIKKKFKRHQIVYTPM